MRLLAALLVALSVSAQAQAQEGDPCALPVVQTDVRPDAGGPPTKVSIGLRLVDLMGIDDISQTMTGDYAVLLSWLDPRLAELAGCEVPLTDVWDPGIVFINSGRTFTSLPKEADIGPGGRVTYIQRYYGALATYHNLHDFPFDRQTFRIWMMPLEYGEDEVQLVVNEKVTGRRDRLNISDWTIGEVEGVAEREFVEAFQRHHSRYDFEIEAKRITAYYVWKVILPLSLIVAMSWAVFWINPGQFGPQIGLSATSMLTLIAFLFATTNMLPALGYFTILDLFIGWSTILVFLAMLESLTTSYLVSIEKTTLALSMDRVCRYAFPLAFVAVVLLVLVI